MTTPEELLATKAQLLFGSQYQTALATAIKVSRRQVINWSVKAPSPNHRVWKELDEMLDYRAREIVGHIGGGAQP